MTDFTKLNEDELQTEGNSGGGFTFTPPEAGIALLRLREVLEFGTVMGEYKGQPKENRPVSLVFELVHPRHAIHKTNEDGSNGDFIRNHEITVRLNKSNSEKSKYMKLFNKMNFDGRVATPKGKVPSFASMLNNAFLGEIHHNTSEKTGKTYVNLDRDGEYTIGAPKVAKVDDLGAPTGDYTDVPVAEMNGDIRCFLWETGVPDPVYQDMWDSIAITGDKADGTPRKNWIQEAISGEDNIAWQGSRAESLFGASAQLGELSQPAAAPVAEETAPAEVAAPADEAAPTADPLAALGL
jgi:hypothetical protein